MSSAIGANRVSALMTGLCLVSCVLESARAVEPISNMAIPTIEVREVLPADPDYAPGAASRLTAEEIEELRPYSLHDALDFIPGVRTIDDDALGRRAGIGVRGAPPRRSRKTLLLEDGTPINASTYLDPGAHYTPPMERLERIDVLKGTGQILYGPLNNHGIVNFRNKQATGVPETTIMVGGGSPSTFRRHLMHRRALGDVGIVLSYTGMNANGVFDVEDHRYDDFYGSLLWTVDDRHSLGASFTCFRERSHYDESNLAPIEFDLAPRRKRGRFSQEHNMIAPDYRKTDVVHDFRITDRWTSSTRVFLTGLVRPRFTIAPGDAELDALPEIIVERPFVAGVTGRMESRDRRYRNRGIENRMEYADIEAFGLRHTLQWGIRFETHEFHDMRERLDGGQILSRGNRGQRIRKEVYEADAVSGFMQDAIRFGDWTVTPGLRVETFSQSRERRSIAPDPGPHGPKESTDRTLILPGISFLYDGIDQTRIFASVARGYSPAIARTATGFPLKPETGINSQVGFRTNIIDGVRLEVAGFYNMLENTIVRSVFTIDGLNVTVNQGDSDTIGMDLGLRVDSSTWTGSDYNVFGELAWNWSEARFSGGALDGNRVPEVSLHAGTFTLGLEHGSRWQISGTVSHFGSFFTDAINTRQYAFYDEDGNLLGPGDEFEIREPIIVGKVGSHTLFSARASYRPWDHRDITFWIQGRNLTDKLYITDLENGLRPGAERSVTAGIQLKF
jgi:Fe(3+) dicitrate transport protein